MHEAKRTGDIVQERYEIVGVLGQGGSGITYRASDRVTNRQVALKELSLRGLSDWKKLELFEREAQVLESLDHPGIPQYADAFQIDTEDDRFFYLVQNLAEGHSLAELVMAGKRFSEADVQQIAIEILHILQYLHALSPPIIHRDIKPQNIIRRDDGHIFLVDFGAVQSVYRETITFGSTVVGTYGYMAPEQFRGQAYPATDLYGLGATLLHLLTHQHPGDLPEQRLKIHFRSCITVSDSLANWLDGLLEPVMEDRFDSASTALLALDNAPLDSTQSANSDFHPPYGFKATVATQPQPCEQPMGTRILKARNHHRLRLEMPPVGFRIFVLLGQTVGGLCRRLFQKGRWPGVLIAFICYALAHEIFNLIILGAIAAWAIRGLFMKTCLEITEERFTLTYEIFKIKRVYSSFTDDLEGVSFDPKSYNFTLAQILHRLPYPPVVLHEGSKTCTFGILLTLPEKEWVAFEIHDFLSAKTDFKH